MALCILGLGFRFNMVVIVARCTALLCSPVYYFRASPISVANLEIDPLGHVRVVQALQTSSKNATP